ncbi:uncharacterized protein PV09_04493 [Verruconis gallopava]|uniref:Uncharacterized protein n=1 Tax=Verruconis gallopava TaxID=253628 RepID=A0A0D2ACE7_9PEZI|nr:uncharacterized protein PV09_04493 [Verruconis gallopava]KIW04180.1 hypothetical protein PV09_04493 [Verruconis gallopava]
MADQRAVSTASHDGMEVKSALSEMLKKSFSAVASEDSSFQAQEDALRDARISTPTKNQQSPSKARSLSDSTPKLSPSPKIKEHSRKAKDDHTIPSSISTSTPRTPRQRSEYLARGLSLQMPPRDYLGIVATGSPTSASFRAPPLSPRVEKKDIYGSPASVLPRHSRGLDFARACTNLHHSTLAEASPDSSPTITQKGMMIPNRKMSVNAMAIDPPSFGPWSAAPASERSVISSSLGSVKMLDSDSTSDSDDELEPMEPDENEDVIVNTPQILKRNNPSASTPFGNSAGAISWANAFSPGASNFQNFHRARLRNGRSRKSSSSASGHSSLASPVPASPPAGNKMNSDGYFGRDVAMRGPASRRESLSLHTHDLHISSGNDSGDEATKPPPTTPGVVRRAVTRRGNLLPKTRAFGRIRAELLEETMPVDAEVKREAEVIRQVRESDAPDVQRNDTLTANSSPTLQAVDSLADALQGIPEENQTSLESKPAKGLFGTFSRQSNSRRDVQELWNSLDRTHRTPPPPSFFPRLSSSTTMSDDVSMDSPVISTPTGSVFPWAVPSKEAATNSVATPRASTPQAQTTGTTNAINAPLTAAEGIRKANKRRRDDDLDIASMKRRAVSPGVSVGNSPILSQSPSQRSDVWGQSSKTTRQESNGSATNGGGSLHEKSSSNGSMSVTQTPLLGPKRVGLQGMTDMQGMTEKMSIE